jgi:hypothetical protein
MALFWGRGLYVHIYLLFLIYLISICLLRFQDIFLHLPAAEELRPQTSDGLLIYTIPMPYHAFAEGTTGTASRWKGQSQQSKHDEWVWLEVVFFRLCFCEVFCRFCAGKSTETPFLCFSVHRTTRKQRAQSIDENALGCGAHPFAMRTSKVVARAGVSRCGLSGSASSKLVADSPVASWLLLSLSEVTYYAASLLGCIHYAAPMAANRRRVCIFRVRVR